MTEDVMRCTACGTEVPDTTQFCPTCGSPAAAGTGPGADTDAPGPAAPPSPGPRRRGPEPATGATRIMPAAHDDVGGPAEPASGAPSAVRDTDVRPGSVPVSGRGGAGRAAAAARETLDNALRAYRRWPRGVQLAVAGAILTTLAFLLLPFVDDAGTAAEMGGRLWWRPILAVVAAVLVVTGRTSETSRIVGVAVAAAGVAEADLLGLVSGDTRGADIGFYLMLLGLGLVLAGALLTALRRRPPAR